ncbi:hypothetical protein [Marinicellulosiphila megalodicopiae]|uniref:hypothetical protein n=1 Tax=Marinicellulosiphila megalodicopiae TaxID=2724896 RepID=UPI003BAECA46
MAAIFTGILLTQTSCLDEFNNSDESLENLPPSASFSIQSSRLLSTSSDTNTAIAELSFSWSIDGDEIGTGNELLISDVEIYGEHKVTLTVYDGQYFDEFSLIVDFGEQNSKFMTVSDMKDIEEEFLTLLQEKLDQSNAFSPERFDTPVQSDTDTSSEIPVETYKQDENYLSDEIRVIDGVDTVFVTYECTISGTYTTNYTDSDDSSIEFKSCFSVYGQHSYDIAINSITGEEIYTLNVDSASGEGFVIELVTNEGEAISYKIELENSDVYLVQLIDNMGYSVMKNNDIFTVEALDFHLKNTSQCDYYLEIKYTFNDQEPLLDITSGATFLKKAPDISKCLSNITHEESMFFNENRKTLNYELNLESSVDTFEATFIIQNLESYYSVSITGDAYSYSGTSGEFHDYIRASLLESGTYNIEITLEDDTAYPEVYFQIYAPDSTLTFIE